MNDHFRPVSGLRRQTVQSGGMTPSHIGSIQWPVVIASRLYRCGGSVGLASAVMPMRTDFPFKG